ncbi:MAG: hypothetical protein DIZ80_06960 [endosymbiont of Galathealinum brachiosum]|uniref:Uncharacterized protein n=1 Tax=endosymbiont of Galathealinum brachiosum TaxID=2200906 RepID=A0A370DG19_9GAMM|nr:MAG: hypothetical protein DIZ80_06960 [endosymbiont of Galathealinum brachiosum]
MHVRYKLRKSKGLVTPKGPEFSDAETISCDIDGTSIKFKAPKHRPRRSNHKQILPSNSYKMDEMVFREFQDECVVNNISWEHFDLFYNTWAFYGPWFTGVLAELRMSFSLVKSINKENNDYSLFHPRAFEKVIGDYLTSNFSTYANDLMNGRHEYIAPVNWRPLNSLPVVAVKLQVEPDTEVIRDTIQHFVFFPISDKVMACVQFVPSQILAASQEELDKRVSRSTMHELMNNIIDSIDIDLSPDATAQKTKALEGLHDTSLVSEFLPLKWSDLKHNNEVKQLD